MLSQMHHPGTLRPWMFKVIIDIVGLIFTTFVTKGLFQEKKLGLAKSIVTANFGTCII